MTRRASTERLLKCIAKRLAPREELSGVEYVVEIVDGHTDCTQRIVMTPNTSVFPDTHTRKPTDMRPVVQHVLMTEFEDCYITKELIADGSDSTVYFVVTSQFVPGRYKYVQSFLSKRRSWYRESSHRDDRYDNRGDK